MSDIAIGFFIDAVLLLCALIIVSRMLYVCKDREAFLRKHKYKIDTPEYNRVMRLTSFKARLIAAIVSPILVLKTAFDIYSTIHTSGSIGLIQLWYVLGFVGLITVVVALAIYSLFGRK